VTTPKPYDLLVAPPAKCALAEGLPTAIAFAAWELVDGPLREDPHRVGHPLRAPFAGCWSPRRGTYRVRYRIDEERHTVIVLDIIGHADGLPSRSRLNAPAVPDRLSPAPR
jgi:mRNA interferase RelE/StbE